MKIFSASQMRAWDAYTIQNEPVASIDLMNRAAQVFTDWLIQRYPDSTRSVVVFAGTGNNGGDGLAVARMLDRAQFGAKVIVCDFGTRHSDDFDAQLAAVTGFSAIRPAVYTSFAELEQQQDSFWGPNDLVIDALFGSGLNRALDGDWAQLIDFLNGSGKEIVSIDLPSGMFCDEPVSGGAVVKAARTFSFQTPKRAFFFPESAEYLGRWTYGSIGLHADFERQTETPYHFLTQDIARTFRKPRSRFAHKGTYGHALIVAGSWGKIGAAVLATRACLRAGAGLCTVHLPRCGNLVLQTSVPEAMVLVDQRAKYWTTLPDLSSYSSIGAGPGIGRQPETATALKHLILSGRSPMVLDADALNILAEHPEWLSLLPENTVLTPHPKEFERLFGKTASGFERNQVQLEMARKHRVYIVLKGANTSIASPDGQCWYNSTGNPGMATGGSGDVLTGIITGLLAQGYSPEKACLLGVYLHGLAGDLAAAQTGQEALVASDLVEYLGKAWLTLTGPDIER